MMVSPGYLCWELEVKTKKRCWSLDLALETLDLNPKSLRVRNSECHVGKGTASLWFFWGKPSIQATGCLETSNFANLLTCGHPLSSSRIEQATTEPCLETGGLPIGFLLDRSLALKQ